MKIWNSITDFILSDLYFYIWAGMTVTFLIFLVALKILEEIYVRKKGKRWLKLLDKYGIGDDFEAPTSVWMHIDCLVWLAEEYNLDSLYEAQDKFDELYTCHFYSKRLSDEQMKALQSMDPDEREFALLALRRGEGIERKNNIEENNND